MKKGFTLVELLVVITTFAFFASIGILIVRDRNATFVDNNRIFESGELSKLAVEYFKEFGTYTGVCKSRSFDEIIIISAGDIVCVEREDGNSWALYFELRTSPSLFWCSNDIDESGIRKRKDGVLFNKPAKDCKEGGDFWQ